MSPWKVILATVIIFGTGVLTGAFVTQRAFRDRPQRPAARVQPDVVPIPYFARREFLDRMDRHLNLSREQYDRIAKILQESQERTRIIVGLVSPEIQDELRAVRQEIREQLTPEQREKFQELQHMLSRRPPPQEQWREGRPNRPRPGMPERPPATLPERP